MDEDAKDLIEWLLSRYPLDRPQDCNEIMEHSFFNDIDWDKIENKEVIPPWIPDLYTSHIPKKFMQMPLSQVFLKTTLHKEHNRAS
mmetsp:Transcript_21765/g.24203  ORF Transcript_21765/g.24203 Transcript_21765/m.24203 type:complete len:86 (-) Transcript_21765:620-877(-)